VCTKGFDPSGPYLQHRARPWEFGALRILQEPWTRSNFFLVGDYTAKVGDPDPGKPGARAILSDEFNKRKICRVGKIKLHNL